MSVCVIVRADTTPGARDVVRQAIHAVEGESVAPLRTAWSTRVSWDPS